MAGADSDFFRLDKSRNSKKKKKKKFFCGRVLRMIQPVKTRCNICVVPPSESDATWACFAWCDYRKSNPVMTVRAKAIISNSSRCLEPLNVFSSSSEKGREMNGFSECWQLCQVCQKTPQVLGGVFKQWLGVHFNGHPQTTVLTGLSCLTLWVEKLLCSLLVQYSRKNVLFVSASSSFLQCQPPESNKKWKFLVVALNKAFELKCLYLQCDSARI